MKFIAILTLLMLFGEVQAQQNFRLTVKLDKDLDDTLYLYVKRDSFITKIEGRQAVLEGTVNEISNAQLFLSNKKCLIRLFIEPGEMEITAGVNRIENLTCLYSKKISGSQANDVVQKFEKDIEKIKRKYTEVAAVEESQVLTRRLVLEHKNSPLSVYLFQSVFRDLGTEWANETLNMIEYPMDSSTFQWISNAIRGKALLQRGNYIDFTQKTNEDESFTLSSLHGKYVLLDFWASWCKPCRAENPKLKELYRNYKDKGLEIVGVSLDHDNEKWLAAIEKDGLPWIHVSDLKGWNNEVSKTLAIQSIPSTILLDKEGRIVDFDLRGKDLEKAIRALLQ